MLRSFLKYAVVYNVVWSQICVQKRQNFPQLGEYVAQPEISHAAGHRALQEAPQQRLLGVSVTVFTTCTSG